MDACRGGAQFRQKMLEKGNTYVETNYRIDYATIPNHTAGAGIYESIWMPVLAKLLREEDRQLSVVIEMVTGKVHQRQAPQQPQSLNRLRLEKTLKLYYNCECIIIFVGSYMYNLGTPLHNILSAETSVQGQNKHENEYCATIAVH